MQRADREVLRSLAGRVREIADLPELQQRKERWYRHHALERGRPLVLCFPEGAWGELINGDCVLEIIMKDTHTVQNEPRRITRWVEIALEEVKRKAGE